MNKTRQERIEAAKREIERLEPTWKCIQIQYDAASHELRQAKRSFDIGETVSVVEHCKRGCCVEDSYTGIVAGASDNGFYNVQSKDHLYKNVWDGDMTRVNKEKA